MKEKGLFEILVDWSFTEFLTIRVVKFLYILGIVVTGIEALVVLIGFVGSMGFGGLILGIIVAPIVFCLGVLMVRIWLEILIVMFRIADNTSVLVEQNKAK
jgi:hypothetical protein